MAPNVLIELKVGPPYRSTMRWRARAKHGGSTGTVKLKN